MRAIKTDDNTLIQENDIRWIRKNSDCLRICIKPTGCYIEDTFKLCKENNLVLKNIKEAVDDLFRSKLR